MTFGPHEALGKRERGSHARGQIRIASAAAGAFVLTSEARYIAKKRMKIAPADRASVVARRTALVRSIRAIRLEGIVTLLAC